MGTNRRTLTLAISDYDHVRDLTEGRIQPQGISLTCLSLPVEEIFHRFVKHREWDVSEMSFAKYAALRASPDCDLTAIPVFPSRLFRQSSVFVRADSPLTAPEELRGKRVGVPEWAQTASVYTRGWLADDIGIALDEIEWVQAGVDEPGRREKVALTLPEGVMLERRLDTSLNAMLLNGEIDAAATAHPPSAMEDGSGRLRRLLADPEPVERAYYERTGIFPIMHVIAIRRAVLQDAPWIAGELLKGFEQALANAKHRALEMTASRYPLPWGGLYAARMKESFGADFFNYGVEPNRRTLDAFLAWSHAQGVAQRRLTPDELFFDTVREDGFKI